jgi:small subunit ribosomal protein S20
LAHSKSALKRWRQSLVRRDRNRSIKSKTRTTLTHALASISDDAATAEESVRAAVSALDKAAQQGIIHKNAAARSKSRLLKRFNLATASNVAAAAGAATEAKAEEKPAPRRRTAAKKDDAKPPTRGRAKKS